MEIDDPHGHEDSIDENLDAVAKFIQGMVKMHPRFRYLDGFPKIKGILQAEVNGANIKNVSIISGGASAHEPIHSGCVGYGMLTAAICGDMAGSPPAESIYAGIKAVTGTEGCLLIVKNNTEDLIHFWTAAMRAGSEGYAVKVLEVCDDCSPPSTTDTYEKKCLTGIMLVCKIAGAAAAAGLPLDKVFEKAKIASKNLGTLAVYRNETSSSVGDSSLVEAIGEILSEVNKRGQINDGDKFALMVNGLSDNTLVDLMILSGEIQTILSKNFKLIVERLYNGAFMAFPDKKGFLITLMKVDEDVLGHLDAATNAPNWTFNGTPTDIPVRVPTGIPATMPNIIQVPISQENEPKGRPGQLSSQGRILEICINAAAKCILNMVRNLNEWGGNNYGTIVAKGASAIVKDLNSFYPLNDPAETFKEMAATLRKVICGDMGKIYEMLFTSVYTYLKKCDQSEITVKQWADVLTHAVLAIGDVPVQDCKILSDTLMAGLFVFKGNVDKDAEPLSALLVSITEVFTAADGFAVDDVKRLKTMADSSSGSSSSGKKVPNPLAMSAAQMCKEVHHFLKKDEKDREREEREKGKGKEKEEEVTDMMAG